MGKLYWTFEINFLHYLLSVDTSDIFSKQNMLRYLIIMQKKKIIQPWKISIMCWIISFFGSSQISNQGDKKKPGSDKINNVKKLLLPNYPGSYNYIEEWKELVIKSCLLGSLSKFQFKIDRETFEKWML